MKINTIKIKQQKVTKTINDCFTNLYIVYWVIKKDCENDRQNNNWKLSFPFEYLLTQENWIRDYLYQKLKDYGYKYYEKETHNKKDLVYIWLPNNTNFIIEAKRLSWKNNLNQKYIDDGVNRFKNKGLTRKWSNYSQDIQCNNVAWMMWFIIKWWAICKIISTIKNKIKANDSEDTLLKWIVANNSNSFISKNFYWNNWQRTKFKFKIYHSFLDFNL